MKADYPTDAELKEIEEWRGDPAGWLARIRELWWGGDHLVWIEDGIWCFSTGGWSGNEDIIGAAMNNRILWMMHWETSRRGGRYEFVVKAPHGAREAT